MSSPDEPPAGFEPNLFASPFLDAFGDLYWGRSPSTGLLEVALLTMATHLNSRGSVHGGLVSSLADVLLGHAVAGSTEPATPLTTASITTNFTARIPPGQWLRGTVDAVNVGKTLAFATGRFQSGGVPAAHMSGVFRVLAVR